MTGARVVLPEQPADPEGAWGLDDDELATLTSFSEDLQALASLPRLRLLHLFTRPHYAEEMAAALGISRQCAMKHVVKLQERGFVRAVPGRRASGPVIEYLVVPSRIFELLVALGDLVKLAPEGGPRMRLAERTRQFGAVDAPTVETAPVPRRILFVSGPTAGESVELVDGATRWTIGRDETRDVRVPHDPFVSGHHAEIQVDWHGHVLVDVFSANGTFLNYARIPKGGRAPLRAGDVIGVGHTQFVYQAERIV